MPPLLISEQKYGKRHKSIVRRIESEMQPVINFLTYFGFSRHGINNEHKEFGFQQRATIKNPQAIPP
jgi:hypothetical protein